MYYSYKCPYCSRLFYVYCENKEEASKELFAGIDQHEKQYGEDEKDHTLHEYDPETETNTIYSTLQESEEIPAGGYPIE